VPRRKLIAALAAAVVLIIATSVAAYNLTPVDGSEEGSALTWLTKATVFEDLAAVIAFLAIYTRLSPWWRYSVGRTIGFQDIALGFALVPVIVLLFVSTPAPWVIRLSSASQVGALQVLAVIVAWRSAVWVRESRSHGALPAANVARLEARVAELEAENASLRPGPR
jgi:hypothetical protein